MPFIARSSWANGCALLPTQSLWHCLNACRATDTVSILASLPPVRMVGTHACSSHSFSHACQHLHVAGRACLIHGRLRKLGASTPERSDGLLGLMSEERLEEALKTLQQREAQPNGQLLHMKLHPYLLILGCTVAIGGPISRGLHASLGRTAIDRHVQAVRVAVWVMCRSRT